MANITKLNTSIVVDLVRHLSIFHWILSSILLKCCIPLDADLFMLGLATHEVHFTILREEVLFGKDIPCDKCGLPGHFTDKCTNSPKEVDKEAREKWKPFIFADLYVLREYLEVDLFCQDIEEW
eukprot:40158_1